MYIYMHICAYMGPMGPWAHGPMGPLAHGAHGCDGQLAGYIPGAVIGHPITDSQT